MLEGLLKGLMQWLYGLFLELIAYCANALLGVMSTDLSFFESSVPVVGTLYRVFVAVGWGLLIGNLAFQSLKAMFAGLGFETESPAILLLRTFLFGTLLVFSKDVCAIGLSIGKNVIDLIGIPTEITMTMPDESFFTGNASWLLVIVVGFILGFQLIKLFFEVAERYVVVAVLTLLCPVGLAMGGSRSTKDICTGFMRCYASMIVMMVMNVLFLKLILSALSTMPTGVMVLPWCLLVVGIAKTARKADNLIAKIGLNPASTGDPLGHGGGKFVAMMAARTILNSAAKGGKTPNGNNKATKSGGKTPSGNHGSRTGNTPKPHQGASNDQSKRAPGGKGGNANGRRSGNSAGGNGSRTVNRSQNNTGTVNGGDRTSNRSSATDQATVTNGGSTTTFGSGGKTQVNTHRFGSNGSPAPGGKGSRPDNGNKGKTASSGTKPERPNGRQDGKKNAPKSSAPGKAPAGKKPRFGSTSRAEGVHHNQNPMAKGGRPLPGGKVTHRPNASKNTVPDNVGATQPDKEPPPQADTPAETEGADDE